MLDRRSWRQDLRTPRLVLTPVTAADGDLLHPVLDDVALHRFIGGRPLTLAEMRERYARLAQGGPASGDEVWANWVVWSGQEPVGVVQATVQGSNASVAWVIAASRQSRGLATEAATALVRWLLDHGITAVRANIHPDNAASQRVASRVGLTPTTEATEEGELVWRSS